MPTATTDKPSLTERVVQRLVAGPLGKKIIAESEAEEFERRRNLAAERATRIADFPVGLKPLEAAEKRTRAELIPAIAAVLSECDPGMLSDFEVLILRSWQIPVALRNKFVAAFGPWGAARAGVASYRWHDYRRNIELENQLREPLPPPIAQALDDLRTMEEALRRGGVKSGTERVDDRPGYTPRQVGVSTYASVTARMAAIRAVREQLQDLALEALGEGVLRQRIDELLTAIPAVKYERGA